MAAPRPPDQNPEWLPSGFPPRSFPPGSALPAGASAPAPPPVPGRSRGRGRWLAAAAALIALLLLAAGLLLATRGDDDGDELATGTSTSSDTSVPAFETTTTVTPTSIDPVSTTMAGVTTTIPSSRAPGVLEPTVTTLQVPATDASAGPGQAPLTLRNTGGTALTYSTSSNAAGLTATPARGTIEPGSSANLTVSIDGARVPREGPFSGTLSFTGTGGARSVQVQSTVGRPPDITAAGESCPQPTGTCSRQIKVDDSSQPNPNPCNTPYLYAVSITDQSRIQSAKAVVRRGTATTDVPLRRGGSTNIFLSQPFDRVPRGVTLTFHIEAVDQHGFGRRLTDETITC